MCIYMNMCICMYMQKASTTWSTVFDFSCASIPDGWWQFVKKELIYIYIIHIIFIYILYILHVQMLCFNFFLCLVLPPEVACFCFMMRLIVLSTVANLSIFLLPLVTSKGQLYMAWNSLLRHFSTSASPASLLH